MSLLLLSAVCLALHAAPATGAAPRGFGGVHLSLPDDVSALSTLRGEISTIARASAAPSFLELESAAARPGDAAYVENAFLSGLPFRRILANLRDRLRTSEDFMVIENNVCDGSGVSRVESTTPSPLGAGGALNKTDPAWVATESRCKQACEADSECTCFNLEVRTNCDPTRFVPSTLLLAHQSLQHTRGSLALGAVLCTLVRGHTMYSAGWRVRSLRVHAGPIVCPQCSAPELVWFQRQSLTLTYALLASPHSLHPTRFTPLASPHSLCSLRRAAPLSHPRLNSPLLALGKDRGQHDRL